MDFTKIRVHDGSQNNGFEELVCQLAHLQKPDEAKTFIRKEGSGGDAGIECYWVLNDGSEIGWQAKYFTGEMKAAQWGQLDKSFKTALAKHPKLIKFVVSVPLDKTDSRKTNSGKVVVSIQDDWDERVKKWTKWAKDEGREIEFEYWGKHELIHFLTIDDPMYSGRALYWLNEPVLGVDNFQSIVNKSRESLGERYTPESHIDLPIIENFDALCETPEWWGKLRKRKNRLVEQHDQFTRDIRGKKLPFLEEDWIRNIEMLCSEITSLIETGIKNRTFLEVIDELNRLLTELLSNQSKTIENEDGEVTEIKQYYSGDYAFIKSLFYVFGDFQRFLSSSLVKLSQIRAALVHGEAGIGKSHLLCDLSLKRIAQNQPTVFILGQHYEGGNPLNTLRGALDLSLHTNAQVLGALDAAGEAARVKTLIIVDAINEGLHRDDWCNHIRAFLTDITKYPNISLALSCRTSYLRYMLPDTANEGCLPRVHHHGFQGFEHRAAEKYMSKQGISKPSAPILAPEFTNPLFLKSCCQALKENGMTSFPKGMHGLTQLFDFFLKSVERTIANRKKYQPAEQIIKTALKDFASRLFPDNFSGLSIGEARKLINSYDPNDSKGERLFDELMYEGILSEDISYNKKGEGHPVIRFTYERFSDHFIAQQIVEEYDAKTIRSIFDNDNPLGKVISEGKMYVYQGIFEALSIVVADKFNIELIDIIPKSGNRKISGWELERIFTETILWRSPESFTDRTLQLLNKLKEQYLNSPAIDTLLKLSTEPNHPWNANLLHKNLVDRSLPERDRLWSIHIALGDQIEEDGESESIIRTLIEWSCYGEIKDIEKERARLCAVALMWFQTTSNRKVRDQATKSLVRLLSVHPDLLPELLHQFYSVNDLYVVERLYAVALGVVCNIDDKPLISEIARIVYDLVFKDGEPIPHILLRDYARGILEYALHLEVLSEDIDPVKFRPPYKSEWPINNPSQEDIDSIEGDEFSSNIKSSLMGFPGDFGNYTMSCIHYWSPTPLSEPKPKSGYEYKMDFAEECLEGEIKDEFIREIGPEKREAFDIANLEIMLAGSEEREKLRKQEEEFKGRVEEKLNETQKEYYRWLSGLLNDRPAAFSRKWARRWVCMRAHELGWKKELFEEFEKRCSYGRGLGYGGSNLERIGKKYQWIALHELLARLSDNVHWIDRGYSDIEDKRYYGPWQIYMRDIDPTLWIRNNAEGGAYYNKQTKWWQSYRFHFDGIDSIDDQIRFMWSEDNLPDFTKIVQIPDPCKSGTWIALKGFWNQIQKEDEEKNTAKLEAWFRINTILIKNSDFASISESILKKRLSDPYTVSAPSTGHEGYLGEYPWHPSCRFMNGWVDNTENPWERDIKGKYLVPVSEYEWESGSKDHSIDSSLSFYMPGKELIEGMGLKRSKQNLGAWCNDAGEVVFLDPSLAETGPSFALIKKDVFLDWLNKNNMQLLWLIGGEKQLFKGHGTFLGRLTYNVLCRYEGDNITSKAWFDKQDGNA